MIGRPRHTTTRLPERLDALRAATELADGRLDPDAVAFARAVIDKSDGRLRHGTTNTVVALLGPTGAGKSSLINTLARSEIAVTGIRRPTTSTTFAAVWGDDDETVEAGLLLDWLDVEHRHVLGDDEALGGVVLLDVPDHDSVEVGHRLEMEKIAERCDLMVWVTDHEKYADAALHHYLRPLAGHDAVMILVLNKVDRLDEASWELCRSDLARLAAADGISEPEVIAVSATTGHGVDQLLERITTAVHDNQAMVQRLRADIAVASTELSRANGPTDRVDIGSGRVHDLATALVEAAGIDSVTEAVAAGTRRDAVAVMGWPFTRWARAMRPHPLRRHHLGPGSAGRSSLPGATSAQTLRAESAIRSFIDDVSADLAGPWPQLLRDAGTPDRADLHDRLDLAVAAGIRAHANRTPRWWSAIGSLQIGLAIATAIGAAWLTVLFVLAWLQIPDPPTPEWRGWPVPTLLFGVGAAAGLLLAAVGRRAAGRSAGRAAKRARSAAINEVEQVAAEMVVDPVREELAERDRLVDQLARAGD